MPTDPAYQAHIDRGYLATAPKIVRCATCDAPEDGPVCRVCERDKQLEQLRAAGGAL